MFQGVVRSRRFRLLRLLVCCLVPLSLFVAAQWRLAAWRGTWDLAKQPPAAVFERVLGIPPPRGVKEILAAGEQPFNGEVWMRFSADNVSVVVDALRKNRLKPLTGPSERNNDWQLRPRNENDRAWSRQVGWEGLKHATKVEYYLFSPPAQSGWGGAIAVDRQRRLFFVAAVVY